MYLHFLATLVGSTVCCNLKYFWNWFYPFCTIDILLHMLMLYLQVPVVQKGINAKPQLNRPNLRHKFCCSKFDKHYPRIKLRVKVSTPSEVDELANRIKKQTKEIKMADLQLADFALMPGPVRKEKKFRLPDDFFFNIEDFF